MPLGHNNYGGYGYFDIPGAMGGYEDALMELAGTQRDAQKMRFPDFMKQLVQILQQWEQRKKWDWQKQMGEDRLGISQDYLDLATQEARQAQLDEVTKETEKAKSSEMLQDFAQLIGVHGGDIVPEMYRRESTPPETKQRMEGTFPLKQLLPGLYPEKEKKTTTYKPTEGEKKRRRLNTPPSQLTYGQRLELQNQGYKIDEANDRWIIPSKVKTKKRLSLTELKAISEDRHLTEDARKLADEEIARRKAGGVADLRQPGYLRELEKPGAKMLPPVFGGKQRIEPLLELLGAGGKVASTPDVESPGLENATNIQKAKIDAGLKRGISREEIATTIEREKDRLVGLGVDIEELYRYLGI